MSGLPCLTNSRANAPMFSVTSGGNIPLNQDIVCSTITVGEQATVAALTVSSINGQQPGGGGGSYPANPSFSSIQIENGGFINMSQGNLNVSTINGYEYTPGGGGAYPANIVASTLTVSSIQGDANGSLTIDSTELYINPFVMFPTAGSITFGDNAGEITGVSSINGAPYVPGGGGGGVPANLTVSSLTATDLIAGGPNSTITVYGNYFNVNPPLFFPASGVINFQDTQGQLDGVSTINGVAYSPAGGYPINATFSTVTTSTINSGGTSVGMLIGNDPTEYISLDATQATTAINLITQNGSVVIAADTITTGANCDLQISSINGASPGGGGGAGPNLNVSTITVADTLTLLPPTGTPGTCSISMDALLDVNFGGMVNSVHISSIVVSTINGVAPGGAGVSDIVVASTPLTGSVSITAGAGIEIAPVGNDIQFSVPAPAVPRLVNAQYDATYVNQPATNPAWTTVLTWDDTPSVNGIYVINANFGVAADPTNFASWYGRLSIGNDPNPTVIYQTQVDTDGTNNIFNANMPMIGYFSTVAGFNTYFNMQASQAQAIAGENVVNPTWNITFYPTP